MSAALAVELVRRAILLTALVAGPALLTAMLTGIVISLLQAVTQIQEQTLTFIPKLLLTGLVLVLTLPWMLNQLIEYLVGTLRSLPTLGS
ncbi:MAG: flagellar biosynthetic protein FliQ [Gemmatimonadales bacterium]